ARPSEPARRAEAALAGVLQELAQAPAEQVRREVAEAVQQAAGDQPREVQAALTAYLTQVPAMVRRVSRRPSDPTGKTVPPALAPRRPEDLLSFLPPKPPRFKPGDRPLPGVDWELEELHQKGRVSPEHVARWMLHLVSTVRFAHGLKPPLVHRDLKPANILVQRSAEGTFSLRITDFGISELAAAQALGAADRVPTGRS